MKAANTTMAALACLALGTPARAVDIHVDAVVGSDANDGLTWASAKATVGAGLALAMTLPGPDVVRVAEGRYVGQVVMPAATSLLGGYASGGAARDVLRRPTILDGAGSGPVVFFGSGTSASLLEGFVVTGGRTSDPDQGGGITMRNSGGTVSQCIVERNAGCRGGGVHASGLPAIRILESIIRDNTARCSVASDAVGGLYLNAACPGDFLMPTIVDVILMGNLVLADAGVVDRDVLAGGLRVTRDGCFLQHVVIAANGATGVVLDEGILFCKNCAVVEQAGWALTRTCRSPGGGNYSRLEPGTVHANARGGSTEFPVSGGQSDYGSLDIHLLQSVLGATQRFPTQIEYDDACFSLGEYFCQATPAMAPFTRSGICGLFTVGDPAFVSGPGGNFYLSQVAAGQGQDSPAVDIDPQTAASYGLDNRTTRTDHVPDSGALDWGFHFPVTHPLWTATDFRVLRGAVPVALPVHATGIASLPWTDAPGVLSDASLPLLFYSVEWPLNRILVTKDTATDSVRLSF